LAYANYFIGNNDLLEVDMFALDYSNKQLLINQLTLLNIESTPQTLILMQKQKSHQGCMLCGPNALLGLKLDFYSDANQQVWAHFKSSIHHQGYEGILHGGFLSALLDSSMCQALFNRGVEGVTADMNIRFLNEVKVNSAILMTAKVLTSRSPLYKVEGALYVEGVLMAKSTARFMLKGFGTKK
jgi:acyl-coenzyme A thioesterase PaaI-like protein